MATFAWVNDEGSVCVTTCAEGVDAQEEFNKLVRIGVIPAGAQPLYEPVLPRKRSQRDKWRIKQGVIVEDLTIPDPPHPKQALLDAIDAATTLAQLRAAVKAAVL